LHPIVYQQCKIGKLYSLSPSDLPPNRTWTCDLLPPSIEGFDTFRNPLNCRNSFPCIEL
jgi:hypothetical protein